MARPMSHLALIMFWKAVVLAVWGAAVAAWVAFKKRKLEGGSEVQAARFERFEKYARRAFYISVAVIVLFSALEAYWLIATPIIAG